MESKVSQFTRPMLNAPTDSGSSPWPGFDVNTATGQQLCDSDHGLEISKGYLWLLMSIRQV